MSNMKSGLRGGWLGAALSILFVLTLLPVSVPVALAAEVGESVTASAIPESAQSKKPALLFFYNSDSWACQKQAAVLASLEREYTSAVSFIEIDGANRPRTAERYAVTVHPTIIILHEVNGVETEYARLTGFQPEDVLTSRLGALLGKAPATRAADATSRQASTRSLQGVTVNWDFRVSNSQGVGACGRLDKDEQADSGVGGGSRSFTTTVPGDIEGFGGGGTATGSFSLTEESPGRYRLTFQGNIHSNLFSDCYYGDRDFVGAGAGVNVYVSVSGSSNTTRISALATGTHSITEGNPLYHAGCSISPSQQQTVQVPGGQVGGMTVTLSLAISSSSWQAGSDTYGAQLSGQAIITIIQPKADLLIKSGSEPNTAFAIDNVYQYSPSGNQIETQTVGPGTTSIHNVMIENDGSGDHSYILKASKTGGYDQYFTVVIKSGGNDITGQVMSSSGYSTPALAAGGSETITIETTGNTGGLTMSVYVFAYIGATEAAANSRADAVQAKTVVVVIKPDLLIRQAGEPDSAFATNNSYQTTPSGSQVETQNTASRVMVGYDVKVQNDSTVAASFLLMAVESDEPGWTIGYENNGADITSAISGIGGYTTATLPPAGFLIISIEMTPDESAVFGGSKSTTILAYVDAADTTVNDSVRAEARVLVLIVNTTGDEPDPELMDGSNDVDLSTPGVQGTLRAAIMQVNYAGPILEETVTVLFAIPAGEGETPTIAPQTALPRITSPMIIDATSQPGGKVKLDGDYQPFSGFHITAGDTTIRGFIITHFGGGLDDPSPAGHGILIEDEGYNTIEDCQIGSGTSDELGNRGDGIHIQDSWDNVIRGNSIWNNAGNGIYIGGYDSEDNEVTGNYIGTDAMGLPGLGNGTGIRIEESYYNEIGSDWDPEDGNIIGGNDGAGILISGEDAEDNYIAGNFIGMIPNDDGESIVIGNGGAGVEISSPWNEVCYNVISANEVGVKLTGIYAEDNYIVGNYIGTDETGSTAMGNRSHGILIADGASDNEIGDYWDDEANLISGNGGDGIRIDGRDQATPRENWIAWNIIGTNIDGDTALPNGQNGVTINMASSNHIGEFECGNLISGNSRYGVEIRGEPSSDYAWGNVIEGNLIGLGADGESSLGNSLSGVRIWQARRNVIRDNVVSGNGTDGIEISGEGASGNKVLGNLVGTDADGLFAIFNGSNGVYIGDSSAAGDEVFENIIGGQAAEDRNVISGNSGDGVAVVGTGTWGNQVLGNYIGINANGTGRVISLEYKHFGPVDSGLTIEVANLGNGIYISDASETLISNNVISVNGGAGVMLVGAGATRNRLTGNLIGTDKNGTRTTDPVNESPLGNTASGIVILSPENTIGGDFLMNEGNVISGNGENGILIIGPEAGWNEILSNFIGCDIAGQNALGNMLDGIVISGASHTYVGDSQENGNVISGNSKSGVQITGMSATGNRLEGNFIGTNSAGTAGLGNDCFGVFIEDAPGNYIGGIVRGARNVISGNGFDGVYLSGEGAIFNEIKGNLIGTDVHALAAIPNTYHGIFIDNGASDNLIGGEALAAANVISGNAQDGVAIRSSLSAGNLVQGNFIGTQSDRTTAIPNGGSGIHIYDGSPENIIGGVNSGAGNTIAFNVASGVRVNSGSENAILCNSIFDNGGQGIDLEQDGVTPNDAGDGDSGANEIQNFPVLTGASSRSTTILGSLSSTPNTTFRVEFFSGPDAGGGGQRYLGFMNVTTDTGGNVTFDIELLKTAPRGQYVTATATDPHGNTSEFSASRLVTDGVSASADLALTKTATPVTAREAEILTYTLAVTNLGPTDAHGVTVVDTLPAGVTLVNISASQGTVTNNQGTITVSMGRLDSDSTATVTIAVKAGAMGTITNTATVTATEPDSNNANNTVTLQTQVIMGGADMSITKADGPDPVLAGRTLTYTLTVRNNGPRGATNVVVTDTLSANVYFVSASASQGTRGFSGSTVTCNLGNMDVGASATVTVLVVPKVSGTVVNSATIAASEVDSNPANNTSVCSTVVNPGSGANLAVTMTASPEPVRVGRNLTYTLTVINLGPDVSNAVTVSHTLPGNTTFVSLTTDHGTFTRWERYSWVTIDALAPGEKAIVTVVGKPTVAGNITGYAYADSDDTEDPEYDNNGVQFDSTAISVPSVDLVLSVRGEGTTDTAAGTHIFVQGDEVTLKAIPDAGWVFSHWNGDVNSRESTVTFTMNGNKNVIANFAPEGVTLIEALKLFPDFYEGKTVKLRGEYRGWEVGHGTPPFTRSDWVIDDETGSLYVTGGTLSLRYPADIGKAVAVSGIVRMKNGQPYIEVQARGR